MGLVCVVVFTDLVLISLLLVELVCVSMVTKFIYVSLLVELVSDTIAKSVYISFVGGELHLYKCHLYASEFCLLVQLAVSLCEISGRWITSSRFRGQCDRRKMICAIRLASFVVKMDFSLGESGVSWNIFPKK